MFWFWENPPAKSTNLRLHQRPKTQPRKSSCQRQPSEHPYFSTRQRGSICAGVASEVSPRGLHSDLLKRDTPCFPGSRCAPPGNKRPFFFSFQRTTSSATATRDPGHSFCARLSRVKKNREGREARATRSAGGSGGERCVFAMPWRPCRPCLYTERDVWKHEHAPTAGSREPFCRRRACRRHSSTRRDI